MGPKKKKPSAPIRGYATTSIPTKIKPSADEDDLSQGSTQSDKSPPAAQRSNMSSNPTPLLGQQLNSLTPASSSVEQSSEGPESWTEAQPIVPNVIDLEDSTVSSGVSVFGGGTSPQSTLNPATVIKVDAEMRSYNNKRSVIDTDKAVPTLKLDYGMENMMEQFVQSLDEKGDIGKVTIV
jgi:hypothetical protein